MYAQLGAFVDVTKTKLKDVAVLLCFPLFGLYRHREDAGPARV